MKKRLMAIALTLSMIVSMVPAAFASEADKPVAMVGDEAYATLQEALDAAAAGTGEVKVEILTDIDLEDVDWNPVTVSAPGYPMVTVNGNGHTIRNLDDMLFAGTWAGGSGLIINDLTIADSEISNDPEDNARTIGVGAFIGYPQASATITLNNCHLVNSTVNGGHWTGGLIGMAGGYNGNDGPVFMELTIVGCSVTNSEISGKGSAGGVIGHASCAAWTKVDITDTVITKNIITSTGEDTNKAGVVMGTIGAAGQEATADGKTKIGGVYVAVTESNNAVTSNETKITTIYGRQGSATGVLTVTGGEYENYPIEMDKAYAVMPDGYRVIESDGKYIVKEVIEAQVGDVKYHTLADAIAYAENGATIELLDDIVVEMPDNNGYRYHSVFSIDKDITVDGNNHKVTIDSENWNQFEGKTTGYVFSVGVGDAYLNESSDNAVAATIQNLTIVGDAVAHGGINAYAAKNDGYTTSTELKLDNVSIEGFGAFNLGVNNSDVTVSDSAIGDAGWGCAVYVSKGGAVDIKSGAYGVLYVEDEVSDASVSGGTFSFDPTAYLADGYMAVKVGDIYTVAKPIVDEEVIENIGSIAGVELEAIEIITAAPEVVAPEETTAEMDALVEALAQAPVVILGTSETNDAFAAAAAEANIADPEPALVIVPVAAEDGSIELDITPVVKDKANPAAEAAAVVIEEPVVVVVPGFGSYDDGTMLKVTHTKGDTQYTYTAVVMGGCVIFTNPHGFSSFVFEELTVRDLLEDYALAYKLAYEMLGAEYAAVAQGYLADAAAAVEAAEAYVSELAVDARLEATKAALIAELHATHETIAKLNAQLDTEILNPELFADVAAHATTVKALADALGIVGNTALDQLYIASDAVADWAGVIAEAAYESLMDTDAAFKAGYEAYVEQVYAEIAEISVDLADIVKAYMLETPAAAMEIIFTAGEDAVAQLIAVAAVDMAEDFAEFVTAISVIVELAKVDELIAVIEDADVQAAIEAAEAAKAYYNEVMDMTVSDAQELAAVAALLAMQEAAKVDLVAAQNKVVGTVIDAMNEHVDPVVKASALIVWNELCDLAQDAANITGAYGEFVADRFGMMAGDLLVLVIENTYEYGVLAGYEVDKLIWKLVDETTAYLIEQAIAALPGVDAALYDWLYNNPDKVIAFFNEYGDEIAELAEEYGDCVLGILSYVAFTYGDDVVEFIIENPEESLEMLVNWYNKYGYRVWPMVDVYLAELGVYEDIGAAFDNLDQMMIALGGQIEGQIEAIIDDLKAQLDDLKAQLENLKGQLENAAGEIEQEILDAIEKIEAAIDAIEKAIKDLIEIVENIKDTVESIMAAVEDVADVIEALKALDNSYINEILAALEETSLNLMFNYMFLYTAYLDKCEVGEQIDYVALGGATVANELYAQYAALAIDQATDVRVSYLGAGSADLTYKTQMEYIMANAEAIAEAELISYQQDANEIVNALLEVVLAVNLGGDYIAPDWSEYVDVETIANVKAEVEAAKAELLPYLPAQIIDTIAEAEADITAKLTEQVDAETAEQLKPYVEQLVYSLVSYAVETAEAVEAIQAINENAPVLLVGMYNMLDGVVIKMNGTEIDLGEYFDYVIKAVDMYNVVYGVTTGNVTIVDVCEASVDEIVFDADELIGLYAEVEELMAGLNGTDLDQFGAILEKIEAIEAKIIEALFTLDSILTNTANNDGLIYIAEQIADSLLVFDHIEEYEYDDEYHWLVCTYCGMTGVAEEHVYDNSKDATCNVCDYERVIKKPSSGGSSVGGSFFTNPFSDVNKSDYFYKAVMWAVQQGITAGTGIDTFSPNMDCTRAQVVTMLWRAAGSPRVTAENPFTDVSVNDYYYNAVLWAVKEGITAGTSATTFSPNKTCSRAEIMTFVWKAIGAPAAKGANTFVDVSADAYYAAAVIWAAENGVTAGTGANTFSPEMICSRAQTVTFLWKVYGG